MMNLFLPYNKTILITNSIFSVVLTFLTSFIPGIVSNLFSITLKSPSSQTHQVIMHFIIWILTGGFLLSAYYFEIARKNEYYFYYNLGIGKLKLIMLAYTLNLIIVLPLIYIQQYV